MSSLRDDVNSRAYASVARGDLRVCHCSDCDAEPEPACSGCRADDVPLDDDGLCAMCRPGEDETCAEYDARMGRAK